MSEPIDTEAADPLGWWAISGTELLRLLREAHEGADPDALFTEHYANAHHEETQ